MQKKAKGTPDGSGLRRRAEVQLRKRKASPASAAGATNSAADTQRLLHELQVHQVELEMQNAELRECRDRTDVLLEKYADLYDFAPVGYFSVDEQGRILEVNLAGAALLGIERSRLINRSFSRYVALVHRPVVLAVLKRVFAGADKQVCEAMLAKEGGAPFLASLHWGSAISRDGVRKGCRVAVSDITLLRQAQEAQRRVESLAVSNEDLKREIVRRQAVEDALKESEQHQRLMLEQSRCLQQQLRSLSHRILQAREEERKRISRELHDDITQILVGITVQLEALARETAISPRKLRQKITRTQRLVERSVSAVHQFAVELRPTSLDDLGLIVTLHAFFNEFIKRTGIRVHFTTFAGVSQLNSDQLTAFYRIIQAAMANVAQHAHASRVKVNIFRIDNTVGLEISDNGKAFDVERKLSARKSKHLGLVGMRERAEMLGGSFRVESAPGKGTTLRVQIPFNSGAKESAGP